ncbi:hypothetical protein P3S68_015394 [Capsicum galapagoense]
MELIEKFIDLNKIGEFIRGKEMMIEIILRNRRIPYGYNYYLNEVKKIRSLLYNRTNTNTLIESVKIKSVYQSASPIAQDISFQPRNKTRSFRSIFSKIVKDIPLVLKKGVEGIRICCSGRLEGAEITRTECGKYGKTSHNVFNQKIYYAPAEVSTHYGISGVKVWILYTGRLSYRAIEAARRAIIGHFHRAMSGQFRRNGKIWVRVLADIPITGKPTEVRMGRGKGNPTGWIARVSRGQILFEMDGVSLSNARQAATLAAHKLCSSTKFQSKNEPNQMIVLEWLFLTIAPCDAAEPWQLGSQDAATPIMQGITDLHHDVFFFVILILVFVSWILGRALWHFHYKKNPIPQRIVHGTTIEILRTIFPSIIPMFIAIPSFALLYSMDEVVLNMVREASGLPVISHSRRRETLITIACQKRGVEVVRPIPRNAPSIGAYGSILVVAGGVESFLRGNLQVQFGGRRASTLPYEYSDYNSSDEQSLTFDSYTIPEDDLELGQSRLLEVDNRVVLPAKSHIRFIVTSADVPHSWAVPSLGVKCDAVPGRLNQTSISVQREGVYYGQCSEICGTNHAFMPIVVEAVPRKDYGSRGSHRS